MSNKKIFIFSAPKHSGKTTRLVNWSALRSDVHGILTPIIDGKRFFMNAHSKKLFAMEADSNEKAFLEVGRYRFSKASFEKASDIIVKALSLQFGWIVIDEIGPLELQMQGFYNVLKKLIDQDLGNLLLLLVIRNEMLGRILSFFNLSEEDIHYWH